jgi:hypothetical protein
MNVRVFGGIILAAGIIVLAIGGCLWATGVPDDGRYHVQADNVLDLISKDRARIERRQQSRLPLVLGSIAALVGLGCVAAARPETASPSRREAGAESLRSKK